MVKRPFGGHESAVPGVVGSQHVDHSVVEHDLVLSL